MTTSSSSPTSIDSLTVQGKEAYAIGLQAFVYGYPMIVNERARSGMTATMEVDGIRFKAPRGI
ncbi:hypothetical protein [Cognatiyoonia sediminum]|uniref:hypothetical protein n=1 Tax=Cognatiyoonia sediminum TaxID=1508389 RepID=UPI000934239C|nr:hypothetical protein [Cognatiyoonia sediminum]